MLKYHISTDNSKSEICLLGDGKFYNGYHVFIPYGITKDLADAMDSGVRALGRINDDFRRIIKELESSNDSNPELIQSFKEQIEVNDKHIKVLNAFNELSDLV